MYCLAFDVAKKSVVGLFDSHMNALVSPRDIIHSKPDFDTLIRSIDTDNLVVILESTSTYHYPVVYYFESLGFEVIILNPLVAKDFKRNLRKTKTDRLDCENLASVYFSGRFNTQRYHNNIYQQMQDISRHIYSLNENIVRLKNRFHQLLELVFPQFEYNLKNETIFRSNILNLIISYPHPDYLSNTRTDRIAYILKGDSDSSYKRFMKYANTFKELSVDSMPTVSKDHVIVFNLCELGSMIIDLTSRINSAKERLICMAKTLHSFNIIHSIPLIGDYTAALLLAELKDISQFSSYKQLNAACGLDPTIIQSGKSINYHGPISKRGNRHERKALFNTIISIITGSSRLYPNNQFLLYYRKKRSEGKHHYASVIACTTKLLRVIFSLVKNNQFYI